MINNNPASYKAVGIAGQIGTGKTTLAKHLCLIFDACRISFGAFIQLQASERNLEINRLNLQELGEELIKEWGAEKFVQQVILNSDRQDKELLVFDGIRHTAIWHAILKYAKAGSLLYVDATSSERQQRLMQRDNISEHEFLAMTQHKQEENAKQLSLIADLTIPSSMHLFAIVDFLEGSLNIKRDSNIDIQSIVKN